MARKLKTYVTTSGFYDLAVAAPSMKAALEIWGSKKNLFQQGFARETDDAAIVGATLAQPGVVLRRAVGTKGAFKKDAELPKLSVLEKAMKKTRPEPAPKRQPKPEKHKRPEKTDTAANRKAAQLYDLAAKRREREQARAEAQETKEREQREDAVDKAKAALDDARAAHEERLRALDAERDALERKRDKEIERWEREKGKLEGALDRARD